MRTFVKQLLSHRWLVKPALACKRRTLTVLTYHRVANPIPLCDLNHQVLGPNENAFAEQIRFLAENTRPLSEAQILQCLAHEQPFPPNSTLVTFDDGYKDNYDIAAPILKQFSVPAIFFIPTQFISERKLGWWDVIAWQTSHSGSRCVSIRGSDYDLRSHGHARITQVLAERYKRLPASERTAFLAEIGEAAGAGDVPEEVADRELMTWGDIQKLDQYGISVGAHTVSHSILSAQSPAEQLWELTEAKRILEEKVGRPVRSLAYPVGRRTDFDQETKRLAASVGYELAFSMIPGQNRLSGFDRFAVRRVSPTRTAADFASRVSFPSLFALYARCRAYLTA